MTSEQIRTIEIIVHGRVQGVFFRNSAVNFAKSLRLTGYIEALSDDSIKIIAQGPEAHLGELIKWCQRGTVFSIIEGMSYKWIKDPKTQYNEFKLHRKGGFFGDHARSFINLGKRMKKEFTPDLSKINMPIHVVIIPDGNRRWARENGIETWKVYGIVGKRIDRFIDFAKEFSIKHMTLWGFSTENWNRGNPKEIEELMKSTGRTIDRFKKKFLEEGVRFRHIGRKDRLSRELIEKFHELETATEGFKNHSLNVALDYGGRDEILRAIERFVDSGKKEISEEIFSEFLDTSGLPDPDLIIRTSGEKRLSGLMPWQSVYSEFYFTNVYFPDFGIENFRDAILEYSSRKRNFGGDGEAMNVSPNVQKINLNNMIV